MIWEVFRQEKAGEYHTHFGNVHAPDREMALLFAEIQHARRMTTNSLWVVPKREISEVDAEDAAFGGHTDKRYRWATTYTDIDADFADEIAASEAEQRKVEQERGED